MDRTRTTLACGLMLSMTSLALGCAQCANPYDYCGPTFTGECGDQCNAQYRAGSILWNGYGGAMYGESYDEDEIYYEDDYGQYEAEIGEIAPVSHLAPRSMAAPARLAPVTHARPVSRANQSTAAREQRR